MLYECENIIYYWTSMLVGYINGTSTLCVAEIADLFVSDNCLGNENIVYILFKNHSILQ